MVYVTKMQVFIPISNGVHKFVLCLNLKYPEVIVFDNSRKRNKNGTFKKDISLFPDMRVAEVVVRKCFK